MGGGERGGSRTRQVHSFTFNFTVNHRKQKSLFIQLPFCRILQDCNCNPSNGVRARGGAHRTSRQCGRWRRACRRPSSRRRCSSPGPPCRSGSRTRPATVTGADAQRGGKAESGATEASSHTSLMTASPALVGTSITPLTITSFWASLRLRCTHARAR